MKKIPKLLFVLAIMLVFVGTVFAGEYIYECTTSLTNEVKGNKIDNLPLSVKKNMGRYFNTYIVNIKDVKEINPQGGIRVFTTVTRKHNILYTYKEEAQSNVFTTTTSTPGIFWNTQQSGTKATTVEWQNRTGNTSFKGTFKIEQL